MCELCEKIKTKEGYKIEGSWTELVFKKAENDYIQSPYKIFAYGEGVVSKEINYCPMCGRKLGE